MSLAPFFYVVSTSFKETQSLFSYPPHWIPDPVYLGNYVALFQKHPFGWWLANTLAISAIVTALKLVIDGMAAYALAKLDFAGKPLIVSVAADLGRGAARRSLDPALSHHAVDGTHRHAAWR